MEIFGMKNVIIGGVWEFRSLDITYLGVWIFPSRIVNANNLSTCLLVN